mmetsp:Transcript_84172/g.201793  ORF Transcript_84172/g.201793 Transcript_84172/m.201793 type:complete len:106 (-) Transcript_84172:144-461(-)
MATLPCLISTALRLFIVAASAPLLRPSGSQNPTGACTPSPVVATDADEELELDEEDPDDAVKDPAPVPPLTDPMPPLNMISSGDARRGESVYRAQSPQAEPVRPS